MKVCLICEGCYPYVRGGVSSWVQTLITKFTDIEFVILTIATSKEDMDGYKYEIPANVVEIKEIFINDTIINDNLKKVSLSKEDKTTLRSLIIEDIDHVDWKKTLDFLDRMKHKWKSIQMGWDFYDIAVELYEKKYFRMVFSEFLWTLRSMYIPLIASITLDIPKADLYHSVSTGYAGVIGSMAKKIYEKPFIITEHGIYTREREEEIIKADWAKGQFKDIWIEQFYKFSRLAYFTADKVITLFSTNSEIEIELGCPPEKIEIIPNGIDEEHYVDLPEKSTEDSNYIDIGAIIRVVPIKDVKTMLLAFDVVRSIIPNSRLWIIGPIEEDKDYYNECVNLIESMEISNVIFTGYVDVKDYINKMDILLLTSISEGQPIAVLEGMASKKPHVCTNVGACRELLLGRIDDHFGDAGIIVPVMNVSEISNSLIKLCKDENLRREMGNAGYFRVKKYYRKTDFTERYHDIYETYGGDKYGRNRL